jgi:very-short-patch-repair endonuclease
MPLPKTRHRLTPLARELRRSETPAEHLLWNSLRAGRLGAKFRRQFPIEDYIVDFECLESHLVIEVDGDTHAGESAEASDHVRSSRIQARSLRIIRFPNREVLNNLDGVVEAIRDALYTPSPPPSPEGGGGKQLPPP